MPLAESQFRKNASYSGVAFCGTCTTVNDSELLAVTLCLVKQLVRQAELLRYAQHEVINCEVDVYEADNGNEQIGGIS